MLSHALLLLSLIVGPAQQQPTRAPVPVSDLQEALVSGLVEVSITGSGGSSGDVITLTIRRAVRRPLRLRLAQGTVLRSGSAAVQNMIVAALKGERIDANKYRPTDVIDLPDDKERIYLLEAYCLDFEKENPGASDRFSIAAVDGSALTVIRAVPQESRSIPVIQAALWLAAGVTKASIQERFDVSDSDVLIAERAVATVKQR